MKTLFKIVTCLMLVFVVISPSFAQEKQDVIYLLDGSQKKGKVISVGDDIVKFSYPGEEVQYELKKQGISKIQFANGREEVFNNVAAGGEGVMTASSVNNASISTNNLLAVVPFEIVSNDQSLTTDGMRREIQQSCVEALASRPFSFQIQDLRTTNSLLAKAGIAMVDIANHTPAELAKLLGVGYVVFGTYDIENKGTSSFGSSVGTYNDKNKDNKTKGTVVKSNNSYTTTSYDTKVQLSIYDSNGRQLFSDTRKPFMGGLDSYKGALKTLTKRITLK